MRWKWFTALAAATALFGVSAQVASAKVPPAQLAKFKALEQPFSAADAKWSSALTKLSGTPTVAQVAKPSLAFVPALKAFDAGLLKIGFTGKAGTDAATIVKLNTQLIAVLSSIHSVKTFETQFSSLNAGYLKAQEAFASDIGVPAGEIFI